MCDAFVISLNKLNLDKIQKGPTLIQNFAVKRKTNPIVSVIMSSVYSEGKDCF